MPFNYLSLFSGIGGLDLGLDQAGMTCIGHVEQNPYCRTILKKHWPEVPQHDDVRTTPQWWNSQPRPPVHLVAGGYPCQPFSTHGLLRGTDDTRWGWPWFRTVIRAIQPRYVLVENVAALLRDDAFGRMLGDLAHDGFDADWTVLSACALGAPHPRKRLFLVAHTPGSNGQLPLQPPLGTGWDSWTQPRRSSRPQGPRETPLWLPEPPVDRVAHGLPKRMVSGPNHALGNAVAPPVAEYIGRLIMAHANGPQQQ